MQPSILDFLINFSSVLWEALPFIVLGALVAGILEELLPQQWLTKVLPKPFVPAVLIGGALGLLFPMCECGIVVVMRRLLRKGLPLSCCIAYMLAGPIVNGVVIFSTWVAFKDHKIGPEMVGLRIGFGFFVAVITGFVVHYLHKKHGNGLLKPIAVPPVAEPTPEAAYEGTDPSAPTTAPAPQNRSLGQRLGNISGTALHDFVDITVFLILGAALAALVRSYISTSEIEAFSREQPYLAIPAMMLLGFLMCLCSEADAFVAASFTNMHITAKLAFLVLGPMLDIKLILMYTRVFRLKLILTIVSCVVVLVLLLCLGLYQVYEMNGWSGVPAGAQ